MLLLKSIIPIAVFSLSLSVAARPWYVVTNGSDTGTGTEQDPFLSIGKAVSMVQAGETIFVRGGTYNLVPAIVIAKSGTDPGVNTNGNGFKMGGSDDKTLTDQIVEEGDQLQSIDLSDLRNGLYIYRIKVNNSPIVSARLVKGNY